MKRKWIAMYMDMAVRAARESHAVRKQVGAVFVSPNGVMSIGINGLPAGASNRCEYVDPYTYVLKTKPEVSHAEENLITKMLKEGMSTKGGTIFCTLAPCINCAKLLAKSGIREIWYLEDYKPEGIAYIKEHFDIEVKRFDPEFTEELEELAFMYREEKV